MMAESMAAPDSTGACCLSPPPPPPPLPPPSSSLSSEAPKDAGVASCRPNQVRSVMLTGVPIVALVIDGKERLCLAQISNTLLKRFSYNEIHNRRVALGITCVQCTPVQLEILRRAGAMPISSRRCGMITKREAERLCRSFLGENAPPKLPDNFSFDVTHECAWGSRGNFLPARYNSSRAKCIKCFYCNMFFSPNKFIFHSHRLPESKYIQPDAANFNSWRRHLRLTGSPPMDVRYAWEDVKAMFNGGSRKRVCSSSSSSRLATSSSSLSNHKRPRNHIENSSSIDSAPRCVDAGSQQPISSTSPYNVSSFPCYPANKVFGPNHPPYVPTIPPSCPPFVDWRGAAVGVNKTPANFNSSPYGFLHWPPPQPRHPVPSVPPPPPPPLPPQSQTDVSQLAETSPPPPRVDYRDMDSNDSTSSTRYDDCELDGVKRRRSVSSCSEGDFRSSDNEESSGRQRYNDSPSLYSTSVAGSAAADKPMYCSAFRPVLQRSSVHSVESLIRPSPSSSSTSNKLSRLSPCKAAGSSVHSESIDVELTDDAADNSPSVGSHWINQPTINNQHNVNSQQNEVVKEVDEEEDEEEVEEEEEEGGADTQRQQSQGPITQLGPIAIGPNPLGNIDGAQLANFTKDELEALLLVETTARKRAENKCQLIKESLEEQVKREVAYREDMAKQLEIVKETLCNELDQERKARFAILQKLKEAHDALHHFSCKMLIPRHCTDCSYKPILPQ